MKNRKQQMNSKKKNNQFSLLPSACIEKRQCTYVQQKDLFQEQVFNVKKIMSYMYPKHVAVST